MNDKSVLLDQLRIDHRPPAEANQRRWPTWIGICIATLLLLGFGTQWISGRMTDHSTGNSATQAVAIAPAIVTTPAVAASTLLDASGYVVARRTATVSATIPGRVLEVLIDEGSRVEQGQIIAKLDDSSYRIDLNRSKAQLDQAKAQMNSAEIALADYLPIFRRIETQLHGGFISAQDFDTATAHLNELRAAADLARGGINVAQSEVASAERNLQETIVRAPFKGVITYKGAQPGEIVSLAAAGGGFTRTGIGTIVDMDSLEVEVDVSENFITHVHVGQAATVQLNAYSGWKIPAEVIAIIPTAERAKATVKVRVGFRVKDPRILPEMGARVSFSG